MGIKMKMLLAILSFAFISLTIFFKESYAQSVDGEACQAMVEKVIQIMPKGRPDPYEHDAARKQFDINSYFTALKHLKINDHYELDYSYCAIPRYGHPYIYKRQKGEPPYDPETACSILSEIIWQPEDFEKMTKSYIQAVDVDGTSESLIQYAIFYLIGDQFFLFDHANYDDDIIIFTKSKLHEVLNSMLSFQKEFQPPEYVLKNAEEARKEALKLDVSPIFEEDEEHTSVKVITFSKWKGFQRHTFAFFKTRNYCFDCKKEETLIPYNCGIMF